MEQITQFISTVDIAKAMGVSHKTVLQKLEGANRKGKHTDGVIEMLGRLNFQPSDFFVKSTYINNQNKEMPCYNCTRKGCEFLAHKFTGEKGIRFTAAYINRFHEMEQVITQQTAIEQTFKDPKSILKCDKYPEKTAEEVVAWKLNDLNRRLEMVEAELEEKPRVKLSKRLQPKTETWYEKNRASIWIIKERMGVEPRKLYHEILDECGKYYDLDEAKRVYQSETGHNLAYSIDLVEYFPQLQDVADQVLDCYRL